MKWAKAALKELEKAPEFVRDMAKQKVEGVVKEKGKAKRFPQRCTRSF